MEGWKSNIAVQLTTAPAGKEAEKIAYRVAPPSECECIRFIIPRVNCEMRTLFSIIIFPYPQVARKENYPHVIALSDHLTRMLHGMCAVLCNYTVALEIPGATHPHDIAHG